MSTYRQIIEHVFFSKYEGEEEEIFFQREELVDAVGRLGIQRPKNLGDVIYKYRSRSSLPESIRETAPPDLEWGIEMRGRSKYAFVLKSTTRVVPDEMRSSRKIPDATPGIVTRYALSDEQALLAQIRYNRLLDIFTGVTCYHLQSHLQTTVEDRGQIEVDGLYVGVDQEGVHYVFPIEAKGENEEIGVFQVEQVWEMCIEKYPDLVCRPMAAQFLEDGIIALIELSVEDESGVLKQDERHYDLVSNEELTNEDLRRYRERLPDTSA